MSRRHSEGVEAIPLNSQTASRFASPGSAPSIASWRCNLTGLSHVHNLYFVAYQSEIHVFEPGFPAQELPAQAALILVSEPSSAELRGHIDPRRPHAVNRLVVQLLGNEEIVAVVRDDGDVDAFLVRHVVQAIDRRKSGGFLLPLSASEVRPIFQRNVRESAWGLAIHSQARIIATSANTHHVTVFQLGLIESERSASQVDLATATAASNREIDVTIRVINGHSNIPDIAFCNTGDDPEGRWLLTTDIGGYCAAIDLRSQTGHAFRLTPPPPAGMQGGFDPETAGWAIMFLDGRSFVAESSMQAALGLRKGVSGPRIGRNRSLWYIDNASRQVEDTLYLWTPIRRTGVARASEHGTLHTGDTEAEGFDPLEQPLILPSSDSNEEGAGSDDDETSSPVEDEDADSSQEARSTGLSYTEESSPYEPLPDGPSVQGGGLPCPILHGSVADAYLLQRAARGVSAPEASSSYPIIGLQSVLDQEISSSFYFYLDNFERLNMYASIPELGVVILASQKGRAVVLALTKICQPTSRSNRMHGDHLPGKTIYAMRADRILPLASQEAEGERPLAPLAGIAASPIQGTEHLLQEKRRWRLLMMYADHTVLSYEIRRSPLHTPPSQLEDVVV